VPAGGARPGLELVDAIDAEEGQGEHGVIGPDLIADDLLDEAGDALAVVEGGEHPHRRLAAAGMGLAPGLLLGPFLGALLLRLVRAQPQVRIHPGVRVGRMSADVGADVDDRVLRRPCPRVEVRGVAGLLAVPGRRVSGWSASPYGPGGCPGQYPGGGDPDGGTGAPVG
jgi:hypothetical protein